MNVGCSIVDMFDLNRILVIDVIILKTYVDLIFDRYHHSFFLDNYILIIIIYLYSYLVYFFQTRMNMIQIYDRHLNKL